MNKTLPALVSSATEGEGPVQTLHGRVVRFEALTAADVALVWEAEKRAYSHPWSLGNLRDALHAGYPAHLLVAEAWPHDTTARTASQRVLLGYWIAMRGVDEWHVLNIAVLPEHRRQGWARLMLQTLLTTAKTEGAHWVWLEVRVGNTAAQHLYRDLGFAPVGTRKAYYPAGTGPREDALVMSINLQVWTRTDQAPFCASTPP